MRDGLFIDDCSQNLKTSNAKYKICFGEIYPWNEDWKGKWYWDWNAFYEQIKPELEGQND